jgi:aspartate carbamoyltransferase catalytic subunit
VQKERFEESEYRHIAAKFVLTADELKTAKPNMKILHPLPRVDEIHTDVDETPHAYYFQQAGNGVYARQALLALVLNEEV